MKTKAVDEDFLLAFFHKINTGAIDLDKLKNIFGLSTWINT